MLLCADIHGELGPKGHRLQHAPVTGAPFTWIENNFHLLPIIEPSAPGTLFPQLLIRYLFEHLFKIKKRHAAQQELQHQEAY